MTEGTKLADKVREGKLQNEETKAVHRQAQKIVSKFGVETQKFGHQSISNKRFPPGFVHEVFPNNTATQPDHPKPTIEVEVVVPDFIPPYTENDHVVDRSEIKNLAT